MEQIFNEEYFKKIDELVWLELPQDFGKIRIVTADDRNIRVYPKSDPKHGPLNSGYNREHFTYISAKDAVELVKSGKFDRIKYYTGEAGDKKSGTIAMWLLWDALGISYIKMAFNLACVYWGTKEPLSYTGTSEEQRKNYRMANMYLGFEEYDNDFANTVYPSLKGKRDLYGFFLESKNEIEACSRF